MKNTSKLDVEVKLNVPCSFSKTGFHIVTLVVHSRPTLIWSTKTWKHVDMPFVAQLNYECASKYSEEHLRGMDLLKNHDLDIKQLTSCWSYVQFCKQWFQSQLENPLEDRALPSMSNAVLFNMLSYLKKEFGKLAYTRAAYRNNQEIIDTAQNATNPFSKFARKLTTVFNVSRNPEWEPSIFAKNFDIIRITNHLYGLTIADDGRGNKRNRYGSRSSYDPSLPIYAFRNIKGQWLIPPDWQERVRTEVAAFVANYSASICNICERESQRVHHRHPESQAHLKNTETKFWLGLHRTTKSGLANYKLDKRHLTSSRKKPKDRDVIVSDKFYSSAFMKYQPSMG